MWNLFKGTLRQNFRNGGLWICWFFVLVLIPVQLGMISEDGILDAPASSVFGEWSSGLSILVPMALAWVVCRTCGWDLRDKTANYEILYGKKRSQVYFSRFLAALLLCFMTVLLSVIPFLFLIVRNGWGGSLSTENALQHFVLVFPVFFRLICFFTALSFVIGNDLAGFMLSWVLSFAAMMLYAVTTLAGNSLKLTWQLAPINLLTLMDFSNTAKGFYEGQDITIYKAEVTQAFCTETLLSGIGIGIFWLLLGYFIFRKKDLR